MAAPGDHAHELFAVQANGVGVLSVDFVHQPLLGIARVLRNFFDEGFVIESVNRFKLPGFGSDLEFQRGLNAHDLCPYPWRV